MKKNAGIVSLGGYLPAKPLPENKKEELIKFLKNETLLPKEYIQEIENTGKLPGSIETNYDGWESQPWFDAWVRSLPDKKRKNPFQGTKERRRVPFDPESLRESIIPHPMLPSDAETLAASLAIVNAGIDKNEIDLVISHSQVPDRPLPANTSLVQHKLGLKNAGAYAVDTCCSTFVTMVEIASALVQTGMKKNVLIVNSIIDSFINDKSTYWSVDTGDAAAAAIVTAVEDDYGYIGSYSNSKGDRHDAVIFHRRSPMLYKQAGIGPDHRQEYVTFYNQEALKKIGANAQLDLANAVFRTLDKLDMNVEDLDFFVTHQPVSWAAHAWREAVGMPKHKFYESFERYANIATCSVPVNFLEAVEKGLIKKGDKVLLASSGAGENHIALIHRVNEQLIKNVNLKYAQNIEPHYTF